MSSAAGGDSLSVPEARVSAEPDERLRAQEQLRRSEERFRLASEAFPGMLYDLDLTTHTVYRSPGTSILLGLTPEEFPGTMDAWAGVIHPEDRSRVLDAVRHALAAESQVDLEYRIRHRDGRYVYVWDRGKIVRSSDGRAVRIVGTMLDQTRQKQAEEELQASQKRLIEAQHVARMGSWVWEPPTGRTWWSEGLFEVFGLRGSDVVPSFESFLAMVHPDDRHLAISRVQAIQNGGDGFSDDLRIIRPDGTQIWIRSRGRATRDADGRLLLVEGIDQDITESRRREEELRQAQKMEAVGRLAGGVAHDFNNLLTVIGGYTALMLDSFPPDNPWHAALSEMQRTNRRAADLTRQLLAFGSKQIDQPRVVDLNEVVTGTVKLVKRLIPENITLEVHVHPARLLIKIDPGQLEQVVVNLVINARDAMQAGGVLRLSTRIACPDADGSSNRGGEFVSLVVSDTGTGMDAATRSRIWEPFFTTKDVGKGTGLGLATVYGIVRRAGGAVEVESEPNAGSTFTVTFPATSEIPEDMTLTPLGDELDRGTETIMIVEDETAVRALFAKVLRAAGYAVLEARDGVDALQLLDQYDGPIDLLLTDVVMPRMGGQDLALEVRRRRPAVKTLFVSGYFAPRDAGGSVSPVMPKPLTPRQLATQVRAVLDHHADAISPAGAQGRRPSVAARP